MTSGWARWVAVELVAKTVAICLALTLVVGAFLHSIPGKIDTSIPARGGATAAADAPSPGFVASYFGWLVRLGEGRLGRSTRGYPVATELAEKLPVTAGLTLAAAALVAVGAFFAAMLELRAARQSAARLALGVGYLFTALPTFLIAYLLFALFGGRSEGWTRFVAPVLVLAAGDGLMMELGRLLAGGMNTELRRPYAELALAKGLPSGGFVPLPGTVEGYAFRQAVILVLPRTVLQLQILMGLALLIEKMFSMQGLADMLLDGLGERDVNRVLFVVLALAILVRFFGVLNDGLIRLLNPRVRTA